LQRLFVLAEVERRHDQLPGKIKRSMTAPPPAAQGTANNYYEHLLGTVPQADYGRRTTFQISSYCPSGCGSPLDCPNGQWLITVTGGNGGIYSGVSTLNVVGMDTIQIGMELYGQSGAHADQALYEYNQFEDTAGRWHYQNRDGDQSVSQAPVTAYYAAHPTNSPPFNNGGGAWSTQCAC